MLHTLYVLLIVGWFLTVRTFFEKRRISRITDEKAREKYTLDLVQEVFRKVLRAAGVVVEVEGLENIPENEAVLFVGNHRSYFDIITAYTLVKGQNGFISKKEIAKFTPLVYWMERLHCLFIDRNDLKQSLRTILTAIKYVKSGISIWIYPEGTRSKGEDPCDMLPFKEGSFKIAEKTGCRIIPVAMTGTSAILEDHFPKIKGGTVRVKIGTPIDYNALCPESKRKIGEYTRDIIIEYLMELKEKEK